MVSRSTRITILLVIDVVFFFIELIAGYAVGSLALVADSFHMLNDVISLIVGLYAIKLSAQTEVDSRYSYGWHRAEILAALINGVFLLALCFTISLEAIERFFSTPNISNPKLIVIVGCFGLASNIVGLFLFHEHGHSHGHSHASAAPLSAPEHTESTQDLRGDVTPTQKVPIRRSRSRSRSRSPSIESYSAIYGHPAATRAALVKTAKDMAARSPSPVGRHSFSLSRPSLEGESHRARTPARSPEASHQEETDGLLTHSGETTPLLDDQHDLPDTHSHAHEHSSEGPGHSHSHGSMNMQGLILHVIGDALGNVGVIAAGLVIWLTEWKYKYSFDPAISLFITIIIFSSALPLVRSASFILLQGVPSNVSLEEVRSSILDVEGVISLHELHVWQLSETKIIASVHVLTSRDHDFMPVAATIRRTLHEHGIHSSTIQPEYLRTLESEEQIKIPAETYCLIACPPNRECDPREHACCPPPAIDV